MSYASERSLLKGVEIGRMLGDPIGRAIAAKAAQEYDGVKRAEDAGRTLEQIRLRTMLESEKEGLGVVPAAGAVETAKGPLQGQFIGAPAAVPVGGEAAASEAGRGVTPLGGGMAIDSELAGRQRRTQLDDAMELIKARGAMGGLTVIGTDPETGRPIFATKAGELKTTELPEGVTKIGPKPGAGMMLSEADPKSVKGAVDLFRQTGQLPTGLTRNPAFGAAFYASLGEDSETLKAGPTNKAVRAGISTAYRTQQNLYNAEKVALGTLDKQLGLANEYSTKVDRSGSPIINKYILWTKGQAAGDEDTKALENITTTAAYEFAKILSGASASIAGVTVSSAEDANKLLSASMSNGQFAKVSGLMKKEADFRLQSRREAIAAIENDLKNIGGSPSKGSGKATGGEAPSGDSKTIIIDGFKITPH